MESTISRQEQLAKLRDYMQEADKNITMMLQKFQWDRNELLEKPVMLICKYDVNHKIPITNLKEHEERCFLKYYGYTDGENLLPDILDINKNTVVKYTIDDIKLIINKAAENDPLFKKGDNSEEVAPLTVERLQTTYTPDERRAVYDAAVDAARAARRPAHFTTLSPTSSGDCGVDPPGRNRSRLEELAALRDRHRRRTKYRAPPKTRNYSDVLRDVIGTQMEVFGEAQTHIQVEECSNNQNKNTEDRTRKHNTKNRDGNDTSTCREEIYSNKHRRSDTSRPGARKCDKTERRHDRSRAEYRHEEIYEKHRYGSGSRWGDGVTREKVKKEMHKFSVDTTSSTETKRTSKKTSYSERDRYTSKMYDSKRYEDDKYNLSRCERDRQSRDLCKKRESVCYKNRRDCSY